MAVKDKLKKLNPKTPPILILVAVALLAGLFVYYVYIPMLDEKATAEENMTKARQKVEEGRLKVRKLDELVQANQKLDQDLKSAQVLLPTNEQLTGLLDSMNNLVKDSGLKLNDWKRVKSVTDSSKLYTQTVISVNVHGSYHELGKFMEQLDDMARLVTVSNLDMSSAKLSGYKMDIPIKFTLIAYSAAGGN
jgi:type IV pilus assembly protein PilO